MDTRWSEHERATRGDIVSTRRRGNARRPRGARGARALRAATRARAGVVAAGPRRLAGDAARPRAAGDERRGNVYRRRSALLDRPGGRPEHAHARWRRASAPPRTVRATVSPRCGERTFHRA